jgi:hypothetical protein
MIMRFFLAVCLLLALPTTAIQAFDRSSPSSSRIDACGKAGRMVADRCMATLPETIVYDSLSDHGPGYDAQGNPVDRHSNIIAVPAARGGTREVFVSEPRR